MLTPDEDTPVYKYGMFPSASDESPLNPGTPPCKYTGVDWYGVHIASSNCLPLAGGGRR